MNDDEIVDFYRRVKDTLKGKKYKIIYLSVDNVREAEEIIKKREVMRLEMRCGFLL